jgi:hypothetical protein
MPIVKPKRQIVNTPAHANGTSSPMLARYGQELVDAVEAHKHDAPTDCGVEHAAGNGQASCIKLFELFGCTFTVSGDEARADECPFCGGTKFSVNVTTSQYQCLSANKCGATGNAYTFINWVYQQALGETTDADWQQLKADRGLPLQTLKRHGIAWHAVLGCWLVPFKSVEGAIQNLQRYWPATGDKRSLPGLPSRLYGLDQLAAC